MTGLPPPPVLDIHIPPLAGISNCWMEAGSGGAVYLPHVSSVLRVAKDTEVMAPGSSMPVVVEVQIHAL